MRSNPNGAEGTCRHRSLRRRTGRSTTYALAVLLILSWTTPGPVAAAPAGADRPEAVELVGELRQRYEVLVLEDSYVLKPTSGDAGFDFIEIRGGQVSVDGERMDRENLTAKIADDADLVLSLAEIGGVDAELEEFPEEPAEPEAPAPERRRPRKVETDTRISFASSMTIEEDEVARDVVVLGGSLEVLGEVDGDAVVVGGSVEVRGKVDGQVTAVGGSVFLGPEAMVEGDVSAIGGKIERQPGARIRGGVTELSLGDWRGLEGVDWDFAPWWPGRSGGWHRWVDVVERVASTAILCVFVLFLMLVARRYVGSVADRACREPWKAGLVGLIAEVLFVPVLVVVFIVLMVSIIGIPLALLLLPASLLGMAILFLAGYAGCALLIGETLGQRLHLGRLGPFVMALLGIALIQGLSIVGEMFSFLGGPLHLIAWLFLLTGFLVKYVAWTVGLGSVLLHGFSPLPARAVGGAPPPRYSPAPRYSPPPVVPPPPPPFLPKRKDPEEDEIYRAAGAPAAATGGGAPEADPAPKDDDEVYRDLGSKSLGNARGRGKSRRDDIA